MAAITIAAWAEASTVAVDIAGSSGVRIVLAVMYLVLWLMLIEKRNLHSANQAWYDCRLWN
jgi:hypothetical protein